MSQFDLLIKKLHRKICIRGNSLSRDDPEFRDLMELIEWPSIKVLAFVPESMLPKRVKNHPKMAMYDLSEAETTGHIEAGFDIPLYITCEDTYDYFLKTVFRMELPCDRELYGQLTGIRVQDELVGVVKHFSSPLMLALKTKKSRMGTYPLIMGGIYSIDINTSCFDFGKEWQHTSYNNLRLFPRRMLGQTINSQRNINELIRENYGMIDEKIQHHCFERELVCH